MQPLIRALPVIELTFSPIVMIGGFAVRLDTLALAVVILACLVVAVRIGRRTPVDPDRSPDEPGIEPDEPNHLRADDLLYVVVAALPGAVVGGRLGYGLLHLDYYTANPGALLDIGQGGMALSLGVVGGFVTTWLVAGLLGAPVGRWMHALTLPLLLALAGGKAAMALGGSGQGAPWEGSWATAYLGPGPWGSLAPAMPSHPAQVYEALATVGVLLFVAWLLALGAFARRTGAALWLGMGLWALARAVVASTWRDPVVLGPLRMEQVVSLAIAAGSFVLMAWMTAREVARRRVKGGHDRTGSGGGGAAGIAGKGGAGEPAWPEPSSRPRI